MDGWGVDGWVGQWIGRAERYGWPVRRTPSGYARTRYLVVYIAHLAQPSSIAHRRDFEPIITALYA